MPSHSAGVECVSRFVKGSSDTLPDTRNPVFTDAQRRTERASTGEAGPWHDPRQDGLPSRRLHRDGRDRRKRRGTARHQPRAAG